MSHSSIILRSAWAFFSFQMLLPKHADQRLTDAWGASERLVIADSRQPTQAAVPSGGPQNGESPKEATGPAISRSSASPFKNHTGMSQLSTLIPETPRSQRKQEETFFIPSPTRQPKAGEAGIAGIQRNSPALEFKQHSVCGQHA